MKQPALLVAIAGIAAAAMLPGPVDAAKQLKKGPVRPDPGLGYVVARIGPANDRGHARAFNLARIDPERGVILTSRRGDPNAVPPGEDAVALIGGSRVFARGNGTGTFVTALTPGEWVIQGSGTTCFCLGSYRFTVAPGEVVDIGTVLIEPADGRSYAPELSGERVSDDLLERNWLVPDAMLVRPAGDGDGLPPELAGLPVRRAELVADVRFDNPTGLLLNRAAGLGDFAAGTRPRFSPPGGGRIGWPGGAGPREQNQGRRGRPRRD